MRPGTFIWGVAGFFMCFYFLLTMTEFSIWPVDPNLGRVVWTLIGMFVMAISMIVAASPDEPIPWNFPMLFGLGILGVIFCIQPLIGAGQIGTTIIGLFRRKKVKD